MANLPKSQPKRDEVIAVAVGFASGYRAQLSFLNSHT